MNNQIIRKMENHICIYPFVQLEKPIQILGLYLEPGLDSYINKQDEIIQGLIFALQEKIAYFGGKMDKFCFALPSKDIPFETQVEILKRVGDFLRFRITYEDENIDYDQGLFVIVFSSTDGSFKVSLNGNNPTLLESKFLHQNKWSIEGKVIQINQEDVPPGSGLRGLLGYGLRYPNEERFWRALDWYSKSYITDHGLDERYAIVCLTIAFEALLNLPQEKISSTFVSYVSNFFSDSEDLKLWAKNFYDVRSRIVHGEEIILCKRQHELGERTPTIFFKPKGATREFVTTIDIARPVFKDFVDGLSDLQKRKKQYDYDDVFFIDEQRMKEIKLTLQELPDGFIDGDDYAQVDAPMSILRCDGTATKDQIQEISEIFLQKAYFTFRNTVIEQAILDIYEECKKLRKASSGMLWKFCNEAKNTFNQLKQNEHNLPYREGFSSNLLVEVLDTIIRWFGIAEYELYRMDDDK